MCVIVNEINNQVLFVAFRNENVLTIKLDDVSSNDMICLTAINENSWLWHRRLGHASMNLLSNFSKLELVRGLPNTKFVTDKVCDACPLGKQIISSFKRKKIISTSKPLELFHMDLFGPTRTTSLSGKLNAFIIVDDYSRFTCVLFIAHKNEAHEVFAKFCSRVQNEKKGYVINNVRSDRGREFDNQDMNYFVMKMVLDKISRHLAHHNKMVWQNVKINHFKKWIEPCLINIIYLNTFGPKPLTLYVMLLIESLLEVLCI